MILLNTYTETDKFYKTHKRIGFYNNKTNNLACEIFNIWIAELYINIETNKYVLLLTADSDEQIAIIEME